MFGTYRRPEGRFAETGDERRLRRYLETIVWPLLPAAPTPDVKPGAALP